MMLPHTRVQCAREAKNAPGVREAASVNYAIRPGMANAPIVMALVNYLDYPVMFAMLPVPALPAAVVASARKIISQEKEIVLNVKAQDPHK